MASDESVTYWLQQLKEGKREAVRKLWEDYFPRLVRQARQWLRGKRTQAVDAEDIALSAFDTFCRHAEQGRFPKLFDRGDLWQLLVVIAYRKTCNQIKSQARRQPLNAQVYEASNLPTEDSDDVGSIFSAVIDREPESRTGDRGGRELPASAGDAADRGTARHRGMEAGRSYQRGDRPEVEGR